MKKSSAIPPAWQLYREINRAFREMVNRRRNNGQPVAQLTQPIAEFDAHRRRRRKKTAP